MELGSSFDYDQQCRVCAATFLPDPGGRRDRIYDEELSSFLIDLLTATRGRALVLSTSYSLLNAAYEAIKPPLEKAGIMVLAQGRSGSRAAITELFRKVSASVLLGTQSFWEGVDIAGETLSCLLLTKLPFHPIGDPLVKGRTEYLRSQGQDPFGHYTLPNAVIRFRQGFGRLIRHKTDRGVIVVTDRRLATRSYGRAFLQDIPTECRMFRQSDDLVRTVARFLDH
jgi:ATP-dependent DNA helicase DinG